MSQEIAEFLLARIAEDEEWAQEAAVDDAEYYSPEKGYVVEYKWLRIARHSSGGRRSEHVDGVPSPARVLAECEAKRRIVRQYGIARDAEYGDISVAIRAEQTYKYVLRLLALPYADHPDYREEWRP